MKIIELFQICSEECSDDDDCFDNQVLPIRLMAETSKPFLVIFSHLFLVCDFGCGFGWGEPGTSPVSTIIVYKVVIVSRNFLESVSHSSNTNTYDQKNTVMNRMIRNVQRTNTSITLQYF